MALGCTGRGSCVWEDDAPNFQRTGGGCGTCSFSRYTGISFSVNSKSPCFVTYPIPFVYRCFVIGAEVSCLLYLKGLKKMSMSSITHFFKKKTSPGVPFFRFGNPNLGFHFVTVILGWWG